MCCEKLSSLEPTHGGMLFGGGFHFDFIYSFSGVSLVVSLSQWARKTLRWMSHSRCARFVEMSLVVVGGVQMNFMPRPRMFLASIGTS